MIDVIIAAINRWSIAFSVQIISRIESVKTTYQTWRQGWEDFDFTDWIDFIFDGLLGNIEVKKEVSDEIKEEIEAANKYPYLIRWMIQGTILFAMTLSRFWVWLSGIKSLRAQRVNADLRPSLVGYDVLIRYLHRFPDEFNNVKKLLDRNGIPDDQQQMLVDGSMAVPALGEILVLLNRDIIDSEFAEELLRAGGLEQSVARDMLKLKDWYPSPQDLVMLAGREAFEEDAIERFDLDVDIPPSLFEHMEKAGVTKEIARWFWVAHWQNPSLNQVFQMIHRGVTKPDGSPFTMEDLQVYYRLADVQPFFGDMLRQIAFHPLGRVDIRRMYDVDVLDESQVLTAYLHLGYSPEHAEWMRDFTVRLKTHKDRDLTRTQIDRLYDLHLIDSTEYFDFLVALGYDDEEAYFLRDLKNTQVEEKRLVSYIKRGEYEYKRGFIDKSEVWRFLSAEDMTTEGITQLIEEWDNEKIYEQSIPSKADVVEWFGSGVLGVEEFREKMLHLKFKEEDINIWVESRGAVVSKTDLLRQRRAELITVTMFREGLKKLGYDDLAISVFIQDTNITIENRKKYELRQEESN